MVDPANLRELIERASCPFCGGGADMNVDNEDFDIARAFCKTCGACGPWVNLSDHPSEARAEAEAWRLWNARTALQATTDATKEIGDHA